MYCDCGSFTPLTAVSDKYWVAVRDGNIGYGNVWLETNDQNIRCFDRYRDSIVLFSDSVEGTNPKDVMDLLILTQYFDTLHEIGNNPHTKVVFLPSDKAPTRNAMLEADAALL